MSLMDAARGCANGPMRPIPASRSGRRSARRRAGLRRLQRRERGLPRGHLRRGRRDRGDGARRARGDRRGRGDRRRPEPVTPCGGCRQKIAEFAGPDVPVTMSTMAGVTLTMTVAELLPGAFGRHTWRPSDAPRLPRGDGHRRDRRRAGRRPVLQRRIPDTGANTLAHIAADLRGGPGRGGPDRPAAACRTSTRSAWARRCGWPPGDAPGASTRHAAGPLGRGDRGVARQGHALGPLGARRRAGALGLELFPRHRAGLPGRPRSPRSAALAGTDGILGNSHASGTVIIDDLGARHLETGWPICYTSADSVFQIAAHEEALRARPAAAALRGPRADAARDAGRPRHRPALRRRAGRRSRAPANRHDYAIAPPAPTLCDWVQAAGRHGPRHRQDRRHLLDAAASPTWRRGRTRELMDHLVGGGARCGGRQPDLRQFRRVRQQVRPPPRRVGLCPRARMVRRRTAPRLPRTCGRAT